MSYNTASEKAFNYDDEHLALIHDAQKGQRHDRIPLAQQDTSDMSSSGIDEITVTQRMVSATVGSVLTSLLVTPLDVVRVRLQSQNPQPPQPINLSRFSAYGADFAKLPPDLGVKACCKEVFFVGDNGQFCLAGNGAATADAAAATASDCAVEETQRRTINSTFDGLKKIARNEGTLTLWRGLSPTLVMAIPANVIYFTGYDWLRYSAASPIRKISNDTYNPLVSGSVARVLAALAVSPIEMFRTRMQSAQGGTTGVFKETLVGMHRMTQSQGYTSLWRGLTLTMWRDVPFSALYWWGYEGLRNAIRARRGQDAMTLVPTAQQSKDESHMQIFTDSFLAGSLAGAAAAFVTTPFDVGKTRQQVYRHAGDDAPFAVQAAKEAAKAGKLVPEELSMPRFLYHIVKEEGLRGIFKGWIPRCLKVAPACAIMISSYEVGKRWSRIVNGKKREANQAQPV